jgi:methionyl-tRNA formyltransferase
MRYNVAILGQSHLTFTAINEVINYVDSNQTNPFVVSLIVSDLNFKKKCKPLLPDCIFVSNKTRNETEILRVLSENKINLILSVQHKWILSSHFISSVGQEIYNLHNASLPEYRGHNSLTFELLNNESYHYSTIHIIDKEIDQGYKILETKCPILSDDTAYSLYSKSLYLINELVHSFLFHIDNKIEFDKRIINPEIGKFYSKDSLLNLKNDVIDNYNNYNLETISRALFFPPYQVAAIRIHGKLIQLIPNEEFKLSQYKKLN